MFDSKISAELCYFSADWHANHTSICRGVSRWDDKSGCRNFDTVEEMNERIVQSVLDTVPEDAYLFNLGDIWFGQPQSRKYFKELLYRIAPRKHVFLHGNHTQWLRKETEWHNFFHWIGDYLEIYAVSPHRKKKICMFHFAQRVWHDEHRGSWHLYGHSHMSLEDKPNGKSLDVGWDRANKPLSFFEIEEILSKRNFEPKDHHR